MKEYDFRQRVGVDMSTAKPVQGSQTEFTAHCPFCHNERKREHQKSREFWFDIATGHYKCHNCGRSGRLDNEQWIEFKEKQNSNSSQKDVPTGVYKGQPYIDYSRVDWMPKGTDDVGAGRVPAPTNPMNNGGWVCNPPPHDDVSLLNRRN